MDYVDWFMHVLSRIVEDSRASLKAREFGVDVTDVVQTVYETALVEQPDYWHTPQFMHLHHLFEEMADSGLIERGRIRAHYKLWPTANSTVKDPIRHWSSHCRVELEAEQEELLLLINRLSPQIEPDHVWLESFGEERLLSDLGWPEGRRRLWTVTKELAERGLIRRVGHELRSSYAGLVWQTRRGLTLESQFIDGLVAEWETTSIDFKRELYLDTADQKAEFAKDVIGLANTQASGRRWMIIGFDDKTRTYHGPPDRGLSQNRMEQILSQLTTPHVDVRYEVVDYRAGQLGKTEVLRDPKKLPYRVAKSIGDKKRIEEGQIFVRHGSQTEEPTTAELQLIQEEGERSRT